MTFNDDTEVTHSQMQDDGTVKVFIETPVEGGFKDLTCILPDYKWKNEGFSEPELAYWKVYIAEHAEKILKASTEKTVAL